MNSNSAIIGITLDSWAIMAWLQGEPPGIFVRDLINWCDGKPEAKETITPLLQEVGGPPKLYLNIVNMGEVFYLVGRKKGEKVALQTVNQIKLMSIEIISATDDLVLKAAAIKMKHPIAYADAFAIATAKNKKSFLMTGDPEIKDTNEVEVLWIGLNSNLP